MQVSRELSRAIERCLRCTENVCASGDRAVSTEAINARTLNAHLDSIEVLFKAWRRWDAWVASETADCSKTWLDIETKAHTRLLALLEMVSSQAAVATSPTGPPAVRHRAIHVVTAAGRTAFLLVKQAWTTATAASSGVSKQPSTSALGQQFTHDMTQPDFIRAVADAARGILAVSDLLHSGTAVRRLDRKDHHTTVNALVVGNAAATTAWLARGAVDTLTRLLHSRHAAASRPTVPAEATQMVEALAGSQLLAAAAAVLVDSPNLLASVGLPPGEQGEVCRDVRNASATMARVLSKLPKLRDELVSYRGQEGRRLAVAFWQAVGHVSVRRLQVALLDQLAVEAGMGAGLGECEDAEGRRTRQQRRRQQQQGEGEEEGWAGSSGTWWFAREQAQRGELLEEESSGTGGAGGGGGRKPLRSRYLQENEHAEVLDATVALWSWRGDEADLAAAAAGAPARPPPLLAARLTARAMEAVCRLGRGEGLDGGYGTLQACIFALDEPLIDKLLLTVGSGTALPTATARACLPHWLEAAGWALAALSDATGVATQHLANCPDPGPQRSRTEQQMVIIINNAVMVMDTLRHVAGHEEHGFKTLPPAAQADVRRRLFRCGLAASLDRLLRLLLCRLGGQQQEGRGTAEGKNMVRVQAATACVWVAAEVGIVPLLPPPAAQQHGSSPGKGGSSEPHCEGDSDADDGSCSGEEADHQLGLLHTLSKRAGALSRGLDEARREEGVVSGAQGLRGSGASVGGEDPLGVEHAAQLLMALCAVMGEVGPTGGAAVGRDAAATGGAAEGQQPQERQQQGVGAGSVAWGGEEARETLALAARAACSLGTSLAWVLAADLEAAATEGMGTKWAAEGKDGGEGDGPLARPVSSGLKAVGQVLCSMMQLWRAPYAPCGVQLLSCQPHRLLAAACALVAALPIKGADGSRTTLLSCISAIVVILAGHEALSGYAWGWLAPPPPQQQPGVTCSGNGGSNGGNGGGGGGGEPHAGCAGCLAAPLQAFMRLGVWLMPKIVNPALVLLRLAAGEVTLGQGAPSGCSGGASGGSGGGGGCGSDGAREEAPCGGGGGGGGGGQAACEGAPDGGFQRCAASMAEFLLRVADDPSVLDTQEEAVLFDGTKASRLLLQWNMSAFGWRPPPPPPSAASGALPPPLVLPPSLAGCFPHLRVCGNPRCTNFEAGSEGALPLKQCGGCRAVRYCGKGCQGAHWRAGHRAECKALRLERGEDTA